MKKLIIALTFTNIFACSNQEQEINEEALLAEGYTSEEIVQYKNDIAAKEKYCKALGNLLSDGEISDYGDMDGFIGYCASSGVTFKDPRLNTNINLPVEQGQYSALGYFAECITEYGKGQSISLNDQTYLRLVEACCFFAVNDLVLDPIPKSPLNRAFPICRTLN